MSRLYSETELNAFREWQSKTTFFQTFEQLEAFSRTNTVMFPSGEEATLCTRCDSEEEYLTFIQRACVKRSLEDNTIWEPWFFESNEYVEIVETVPQNNHEDDFENSFVKPSVFEEAYLFDCTPYTAIDGTYSPFSVTKRGFRKYSLTQLNVPQHIIDQFPFIITFYSIDTFDRMGSVKGNLINILPLKKINNKEIYIL